MSKLKQVLWALVGLIAFLALWAGFVELRRPAPVHRATIAFSTPASGRVFAVVIDGATVVVAKDEIGLAPSEGDDSLAKLRTLLGAGMPTLAAFPPGVTPRTDLGKLVIRARDEAGIGLECYEQGLRDTPATAAEDALQRAHALQDAKIYHPPPDLPPPWTAGAALVELSHTRWDKRDDVLAAIPPVFTSLGTVVTSLPSTFPSIPEMAAPFVGALDAFQRALTKFNEILGHAFASIVRVGVGFLLGVVLGIPLGLALGSFAWFNALLNAVIQALRPISPIAWLPIAALTLKGGTLASMFLIFLAALFPIAISTAAAVATLDLKYRRSAMNFGVHGYEFARRVLLPATMPSILTALRVAIGIAWIVIVAAEMCGVEQGLGYLVLDARNQLRYDRVVAAMIVIGVLGLGIDMVFRYFERRILERRGIGAR